MMEDVQILKSLLPHLISKLEYEKTTQAKTGHIEHYAFCIAECAGFAFVQFG